MILLYHHACLSYLTCCHFLQGFIRNEIFNPKMWVIPGDRAECLPEDDVCFSTSKVIYSRGGKLMKSKVVADVVEALIGAYLTTGGEFTALFLMEWLGMKIDFVDEVPSNIPFLEKPEMYVNVHHLESLLKYKFRNPSLLVEALTHGSYQLPDIPRCYQVIFLFIMILRSLPSLFFSVFNISSFSFSFFFLSILQYPKVS